MPDSDKASPWAGLIDIGAITGVSVALLYTAGWSYAYHYFQQFHLGLIGLEIEREYFLLYGFWVCKARWCLVLLCLLAAFGLPLLFQRCWQQAELRSKLRAVAQLGGPIGLLLLFIALYQLGAGTGKSEFAREQRGDFPSYPRVKVWLKDEKDKRGEAWAKGCHRLLLRGKEQLYLFRPDKVSIGIPTEIVPNSEVAAVRVAWCEEDAEKILKEMNIKATAAYGKGNYQQGIILAKQAYAYAIEHFGKEHQNTLGSISNLAILYQDQGRYSKAEPLLKQVLQLREKVIGKEHPDTLSSMNNLAFLYEDQERYDEAEQLFKKVLQLREKVIGKNHPETLGYISSLAASYYDQGRYSEAEPLLKKVLQLSFKELKQALKEEMQGEKNSYTLILAKLYMASIDNLAVLYDAQGHYGEAESLHKQALQLKEDILGKGNLETLNSIDMLAVLYYEQGRYSEAEPLFKQVLHLREEVLGKEHPNTLQSMNNIAGLYDAQKRYSEAEPFYKQALQLKEKVLGNEHPHLLDTQTNYIYLLISTSRSGIALRLLQDQGSRLLSRSFQELYSSSSEKVRRLYMQSISNFQDEVLSLANQQQGKEYQQHAAEVMLRWKQVYAEESGVQHRLLNLSNDPEAEKLRTELAASQAKVSQALRQPKEKENIPELIEKANQDETALLALARHLRTGLKVKDVTLGRVLAALPQHSGLIEYRLFQIADFKAGKLGEPHLAALLLLADPNAKQRFVFRDLGPFAEIEKHLHDETAEAYKRLLGPFDEHIKNLKQLYIAPDGPLNLLSFASLRLPAGRFLAERQQINNLQTGRDLLQTDNNTPPGKGIVIIGGAKYGSMPAGAAEQAPTFAAYQQRAARELAQGIVYLEESRREAQAVGKIFTSKTGEQPAVLIGDDASEYNLKHLEQPPSILHLSTHGFYLAQDEKSPVAEEAPLLLSGLALAGANNGLQGRLDKHGTELVSLSACETGKGVLDYSEGVYGLVRAFRTAGAKSVLMTLTPVGDKASRDFMETFYDKWLSSETSISPAEALHQTRLQFIHDKKPPQDRAPFVLVGK